MERDTEAEEPELTEDELEAAKRLPKPKDGVKVEWLTE